MYVYLYFLMFLGQQSPFLLFYGESMCVREWKSEHGSIQTVVSTIYTIFNNDNTAMNQKTFANLFAIQANLRKLE